MAMVDPKQIPHLIKLLDDESTDIQNRIIAELTTYGPSLRDELSKISFPLTPTQRDCLHIIFKNQKSIWLRHVWPSWFNNPNDSVKLEKALNMLSCFLDPSESEKTLGTLLDDLASQYKAKFKVNDARLLAQFLFKIKGLQGNEDDYYNPQNSNLIYVIKYKRGIPISLASIYMLVGHRLGLHIEGCHFPGHFLARIDLQGKKVYVDCFSSGQIIHEHDMLRLKEKSIEDIQEILNEKAEVDTIIRRYLANLIRAFQTQDDAMSTKLMVELFKDLDKKVNHQQFVHITPEEIIRSIEPLFQTGQLVRHKELNYRGIIVDIDGHCLDASCWEEASLAKINPHQPWYHVLIDGSDQVTYVCEEKLIKEDSKNKISHPLLLQFFTKLEDGQYIRNDNPWPGTDS